MHSLTNRTRSLTIQCCTRTHFQKHRFMTKVFTLKDARGLPGFVNLLGIESPGLTSSLAIAEKVARMLRIPIDNNDYDL